MKIDKNNRQNMFIFSNCNKYRKFNHDENLSVQIAKVN